MARFVSDRLRTTRWVTQGAVWLFLLISAVLALFPVVWTLLTSFKPPGEVQSLPPTWLPDVFTLKNYVAVVRQTPVLLALRNSAVIVAGTIALSLLLGVPAAYGASRFNFLGKRFLLMAFLATRFIAPPALVVPFLVVANRVHILDTFLVLILANTYMWLPFLVWLLKGTFDLIPREIIDAAVVDGCSNLGVLFRTMLPLSVTGLVSYLILIFVDTWNELLFATALTQSPAVKPITTTMLFFYTDVRTVYGHMTAAGVLGIIPAVVFTVFFSRYIVKGLVAGAVKG